MEADLAESWADTLSKILRMGTNNPESNRILSKAKKDREARDSDTDQDDDETNVSQTRKSSCLTKRLKPHPQRDALLENELKSDATRGVVHLFNAVKTVNPKSDKKRKKKKKKKMKKRKKRRV